MITISARNTLVSRNIVAIRITICATFESGMVAIRASYLSAYTVFAIGMTCTGAIVASNKRMMRVIGCANVTDVSASFAAGIFVICCTFAAASGTYCLLAAANRANLTNAAASRTVCIQTTGRVIAISVFTLVVSFSTMSTFGIRISVFAFITSNLIVSVCAMRTSGGSITIRTILITARNGSVSAYAVFAVGSGVAVRAILITTSNGIITICTMSTSSTGIAVCTICARYGS